MVLSTLKVNSGASFNGRTAVSEAADRSSSLLAPVEGRRNSTVEWLILNQLAEGSTPFACIATVALTEEQRFRKSQVTGSNPVGGLSGRNSMVEYRIFNPKVEGSIPFARIDI